MFELNDILYGKAELPRVFSDLLQTDALKRLAGIHQSGAIFLVNPDLSHSRLEHAIGVMLLIRKLGGSELEQIAGLLHDVSHTAFSHVADYVFDCEHEDYHEQIFENVILNSEIPEVLEKYGYNARDILKKNFPILEQPLPGLCADRLDYTLRDGIYSGIISRQRALSFLKSITLKDSRIAVLAQEEVNWINETYKRLNEEVFKLPLYMFANGKMADLIKSFLSQSLLKEEDLFKTDILLLNKIRSNYSGYEAIKAIKQLKGFPEYIRSGKVPKVKNRELRVSLN